MHTTNYVNTLIEIAEDCKVSEGTEPPVKENRVTAANLQFKMLFETPYQYTSDEVLWGTFAERKGFEAHELEEQKEAWFSKGQPCFRASPLTKSYGWGVHSNAEGKVAIYCPASKEYRQLLEDPSVKKVKAMRSKRK